MVARSIRASLEGFRVPAFLRTSPLTVSGAHRSPAKLTVRAHRRMLELMGGAHRVKLTESSSHVGAHRLTGRSSPGVLAAWRGWIATHCQIEKLLLRPRRRLVAGRTPVDVLGNTPRTSENDRVRRRTVEHNWELRRSGGARARRSVTVQV